MATENINGFVIEDGKVITGYTGQNTALTVPEGIEMIDYNAFNPYARPEWDDVDADTDNAYYLQSIVLPQSLRMINSGAFESSELEEITVPAGVDRIEADAFSRCFSLRKVVIMNPECDIDPNGAFEECETEMIIYSPADDDSVSSVEQYALDHGIRFRPL